MKINDGDGQFDNVLDLDASRQIKQKTGVTMPIKLQKGPATPFPEADEAMALANSARQQAAPKPEAPAKKPHPLKRALDVSLDLLGIKFPPDVEKDMRENP